MVSLMMQKDCNTKGWRKSQYSLPRDSPLLARLCHEAPKPARDISAGVKPKR
jgi:hypothetical protein